MTTPKTPSRSPSRRRRSGFTLLEVVLSSSVLAILLLGATTAFSSSLVTIEKAKRITRGTLLLETVMEDVGAQPYSNLLALDGNQIFDGVNLAQSDFAVDLTVFQSGVDQIQIVAALVDRQSGDELGRVAALRSDR